MELLNNTSPEAEVEIEFNKALLPDDEYVYCLYSGKKGWKDAIFVYDWEGHFVTFIELDFGEEEPENLSVHNGALFVGTGNHKQVFFYNISELKMLK